MSAGPTLLAAFWAGLRARAAADDPHARALREGRAVRCPRCGATSHHPMDVQEGYCGRCHDWTSPGNNPRAVC